MAYVTIATRLPKEDERELEAVMKQERLDKSAAARKVIEIGLAEWRKEQALEKLRNGRISLLAAAQAAGLSVWEMIELVKEKRVDYLRISAEELERELEMLSR